MSASNPAPVRGIAAYLVVTFALSWLPAWWLADTWLDEGRPLVTRLLTWSLYYAVSMGWQPLAAAWLARRWLEPANAPDLGLRLARAGFVLLGGWAALTLVLAAAALAWLSASLDASAGHALDGRVEPELVLRAPSWTGALQLTGAFAATLALTWAQCVAEEVGWRGFFMVRLMQRLGPWLGLAFHGALWGLWYVPVIAFAHGVRERTTADGAAFVLTCTLLGVLLGGLRLASGSVVPTVVANAVLTLSAGLAFRLQGVDVGPRGAAYGPPGWVVMAVVIAALAASRWRAVVASPASATPRGGPPR